MFLTYAFISISIESIIYMVWALVFSILLVIIGLFVVSLVFTIIKNILKCLFSCCIPSHPKNDNIDMNIGQKDIELNERNENNDNEDKNNNGVNV